MFQKEPLDKCRKNVCPHFHYNVPEEEEDSLRQGEDKHHDSSKPWQLYLLPYHCSLGRVKAKLPKQSPTKDLTKHNQRGRGRWAGSLQKALGCMVSLWTWTLRKVPGWMPWWAACIREHACHRRMHLSVWTGKMNSNSDERKEYQRWLVTGSVFVNICRTLNLT